MSGILVHARHIRAAGYCVTPGGKEWFEHHKIDWRSFVRNGIPLEALQKIDDEMCRRVCNEAIKEYENGAGNRV